MSRLDFIRNHDVFCYECSYWESLPDTRTLSEATEKALSRGFKVRNGRIICATCHEAHEAQKETE